MKRRSRITFVTVCLLFAAVLGGTVSGTAASAADTSYEDSGTDIVPFLGMTYAEIQEMMPDLFEAADLFGSGRTFLTDGLISFYFEYNYGDYQDQFECKVNRIVVGNNDYHNKYRIGKMMCLGATRADEREFMSGEGYTAAFSTGDERNVWTDGQHIVIVTRGPYASCSAMEISFAAEDDF